MEKSAPAPINNHNYDDDFPSDDLEGEVPWTQRSEDVNARNDRMKYEDDENARLESEVETGPRSVPLVLSSKDTL